MLPIYFHGKNSMTTDPNNGALMVISFLLIAYIVIFVVAKLSKRSRISKAVERASTTNQYYVDIDNQPLHHYSQVDIWFDKNILAELYPHLSTNDIGLLMDELRVKSFTNNDFLFVQGKMVIVLRAPAGAVLSFSNGRYGGTTFSCKPTESAKTMGLHFLEKCNITQSAINVATVNQI